METSHSGTDQLPLMDRFHAATFSSKLGRFKLHSNTRRILSSYRIKLRQAERFVIDDDAVRLVCHLSHQRDRLEGWSFLARLPFPVVWLEFNLHTKVREFGEMGSLRQAFDPAEVSPAIGYLLYKDGDSSSRWIAHEVREFEGEPIPGMIAFLFDPENNGISVIRGSDTWNSPTLSRRPNFPKIPAVVKVTGEVDIPTDVDAEFVLCGLFGRNDGEGNTLSSPEWFASRSAAIVDPFWEQYLSHRPRDDVNDTIAREVKEQAGVMRWLVTLFATINGLPRDIRKINTRPGRRSAGMNMIPYLQHSNLSITVPRDDHVVWAKDYLDREATGVRRAWHMVIGHWRVIELGKAKRGCRHIPLMVEDGVGICERCELMIRWIELPDGRGDPTVGIVEHTYTVHGKRHSIRKPGIPNQDMSIKSLDSTG